MNRSRFSSSEVEKEVTWQNLAKICPPFLLPVLAKTSLEYIEAQRNVFSVTSTKSRTFHNDGAEYRFKRFIALSGSASHRTS